MRVALLILASSFLIPANFSVVFLVIRGMNFDIPIPIIVMGSTFTVLSTLLPIYGIAGLGTSQGLWTRLFCPWEFPRPGDHIGFWLLYRANGLLPGAGILWIGDDKAD